MLDTLIRAFRGTIRSPLRSLLVVLLLAAGLSFALTSLALAFAADDELNKIKQTTGVEAGVSIHPNQFANAIQQEFTRSTAENVPFDSSRVPQAVTFLSTEQADEIAKLPYVRRVESFTVVAPEFELPDGPPSRENDLVLGNLRISLPDAVVTGTRDSAFLADFQSGAKRIIEGQLWTQVQAEQDVVVIDQETATVEELAVGDKIVLKQQVLPEEGEEPPAEPQFHTVEAEIIGIFDDVEAAAQGAGFSPAQIQAWYAPLTMVRKLQGGEDSTVLTQIAIIYDSVDSAPRLEADIGAMLDPKLFVVTTTRERYEDISDPVETMRSTSFLAMGVGLAVVALIMVLLMALVIRGRLREIGILKAIGARDRQVVLQFATETVGIAVMALVVAIPISLGSNSLIADAFKGDASVEEAAGSETTGQGPDLGSGARALTAAPIIDDPVRTEEVEAILDDVDATVGADIIAVAAGVAVGLGLLGALVPTIAVMRLRPAEVLRLEA